ncbi:MAG: right-handed parallel beta-helix repeat-containing protein [Pirellulales bacterium]|nr:right-handed parallel beta-helix repeat-containing protein [Pirellulales bacterium]
MTAVPILKTAFYLVLTSMMAISGPLFAREFHVAVDGNDANDGSDLHPFKTISAAAQRAQPGDVIAVHEGVYRERVNPQRGGESDENRIIYHAALGESVVIKGSEVIQGWQLVQNDTWKVIIPNEFFGNFNPYNNPIHGDWFNPLGRTHHTGAVYLNGHWLTEAANLEDVLKPIEEVAAEIPLWFAEVDASATTIWAQFRGVDPNRGQVEINVRQSVFYPDKPGVNYLTVRGFTMEHAATPWAPPTAEQIGLIGTHWSKGWIIEQNTIRYSVCTGITLGKHGDAYDNTSQDTAEGYVKTIERALAKGWSKNNIGHHIVRRNHISHCEQAGIVGSMGPVFCSITGNTIHDIHVRRLFTGAEMAGIKFHGAIDTVISHNHIYRTCRGIWLDWMSQGTRVTRNLLHDNGPYEDLFVEVNHGPFLVDHNIFLSPRGLLVNSQGGAYAHNLIAGSLSVAHGEGRETPYHQPHSTEVVGLHGNPSGDDRYYNNIFAKTDLTAYDPAKLPVFMAGNVFLDDAKPSRHESDPMVDPNVYPGLKLAEKPDGFYLDISLDPAWADNRSRPLVTTEFLGQATIPKLPYEQPDGTPYCLDTDYFGTKRNEKNPFPGPFESLEGGRQTMKVWPTTNPCL